MIKKVNGVELVDSVGVCLECSVLDKAYKDFKDSSAPYKGLYVESVATHSDKLINSRIYLAGNVSNGVKSFLTPYRKPVLAHHDDHADPIGRVMAAHYIDTATEGMGRLKTLSSKRDLYVAHLMDNYLFDTSYNGTGYIQVGLDITDKEAIEKVMDERYMTMSIGFDSDHMYCSHCGADWKSEEFCEHLPGANVDGMPVFSIMGNMSYNEISFVNKPADGEARVVAKGNENQAIMINPYASDSLTTKFSIFRDSMEGFKMFMELIDNAKPESRIKLEELMACEDLNAYELYLRLPIDEKFRVTKEAFDALPKSAFCGPDGNLPMVDLVHFNAIKEFLKSFDETKEKERTINRTYYRAKKLGLLPSNPFSLKIDEMELDLNTPESTKEAYKALVAAGKLAEVENSDSEGGKVWSERIRLLNINLDELKEELTPAVVETSEVVADDVVEPEVATEDASAEEGVAEETPNVDVKKEFTVEELYTIFSELNDELKDEFRSLIDTSAGQVLGLTDEVIALKFEIKAKDEEIVKTKDYTKSLEEQDSLLKIQVAQTIVDYRDLLQKNKSVDKSKLFEELKGRTIVSLMDTIKDLRRELFEGEEELEEPVPTTPEGQDALRRNSATDSLYKTEPVDFNKYFQLFMLNKLGR